MEMISLPTLLTSVAGSVVSGLIGNMFSGDKEEPAAPKVEKATVMPTADGADVQAARKRSLAEQMRRRGRASTTLHDDDTLGG